LPALIEIAAPPVVYPPSFRAVTRTLRSISREHIIDRKPSPAEKTFSLSSRRHRVGVSQPPEKRNAMSAELAYEMLAVLEALEIDDRAGVLVLTGTGDAFSAGMT